MSSDYPNDGKGETNSHDSWYARAILGAQFLELWSAIRRTVKTAPLDFLRDCIREALANDILTDTVQRGRELGFNNSEMLDEYYQRMAYLDVRLDIEPADDEWVP